MEPWELRSFIEDLLKKQDLYSMYTDLCQRLEVIPVSLDKFIDMYVDIVSRRDELYKEAKDMLNQDKKTLLDTLERGKYPLEDLVSVDMLPPSVTVTLNKLSDGIICLYVLFPTGPDTPYVVPAHISNNRDSTFI